MDTFWISFYTLVSIQLILLFFTKKSNKEVKDENFTKFQWTYMTVFLLAMAADWLNGPYFYALYQDHGMTDHQIELLFVAGFGSSMIFGTIVGSFADQCGRKANCQLYAVLYILSCVTMHIPNFWILLIGRFLGGVATSILFSSFESWLICEHTKRGYSTDALGIIFSRSVFGNSIVAIGAGQLAQVFVGKYGLTAPYDLSICVLLVLLLVISFTWTENYGNSKMGLRATFSEAVAEINQNRTVQCLGLLQALFEGSMYTFVLKWTPALTPVYDEATEKPPYIPHGLIFSSFMVSMMVGSSIFQIICKFIKIESFMRATFLCAALSFAAPLIANQNRTVTLVAFFIFEICVGMFWPAMGTMRSRFVPESVRSTVMNIFRIPLNFIVILILLQNLSMTSIFTFCALCQLAAAIVQHVLYTNTRNSEIKNSKLEEVVQ